MMGKLTLALIPLTLLLAACSILFGPVSIPATEVARALTGMEVAQPSWGYIVTESRLPQTVTAILCGASLSTAGLLLQTSFRNPLAGPSILGITSGASLGAAIVMLLCGGVIAVGGSYGGETMQAGGIMAVMAGAFIGAMAVIALLLSFTGILGNRLMLLITGLMVSYLTSSVVSLLNFFADAENIQSYVMWGMGSFSDVTLQQLPWFAAICLTGLCIAILLTKPLNALLLGDDYAQNLGVNIRRTHRLLLLATGLLTAACTACCGPVAFLGLAVPHIARLITGASSHTVLLPTTMLCGACLALLCNIICVTPTDTVIPLNAVTPIFGAPVIIYIIIKSRTA